MKKIIFTLENNSKVIVETFLTEKEFWEKFQDNFEKIVNLFDMGMADLGIISCTIDRLKNKKKQKLNCESIDYWESGEIESKTNYKNDKEI